MKRSIIRGVIAIVMSLSAVSFGSANLSGEYWFGSLGVDVGTNAPLAKRGTVSISGNQWEQEWDDYDGPHTFSSAFTTTAQADGSIDVNFVGVTYNVAWNGDVMIHAGGVLGGGEEGIDIFTRKATNVDVNDVLGDHGFFGHQVNISGDDDSCGWGNATLDADFTGTVTWTNDHGDAESMPIEEWSLDDVNAMINVPGPTIDDPVSTLFLGKGGIGFACDIVPEESRDGVDLGYNIFIKKTEQVITMADIAGAYQVRFLETGPGAVPYTCGLGLCVIGEDGSLSVNAYYSDDEHDVFSADYTVGPGNAIQITEGDNVNKGIISPDKNLIFIPEYRYENPPTRTDYDWLGGIFLIRVPADCRYVLDGDLNKDCRVDFYDFSILAQNWLVDCDESPLDPACRCDIPWVAEAPMNMARDQFAGGVIDGRIYVFGGNGNPNGINLKSTERYDPATMRWSRIANNEHNDGRGVEELTAAVVNNKLYVFGGWGGIAPDGYNGVFNFNEMYDPATNGWTTLAQRPTTVAAAPTTVYNNEIYLFGGYFDSDNPSQGHDDYDVVECYDPNTDTWRFVTNMPKVLGNFGIATIGAKVYLFGGVDWSEPSAPQFHDKVITYDFQTDLWATIGNTPTPTGTLYGYSVAAPVVDGKVYLVGRAEVSGMEMVYSRIVDIYDPTTNTWDEGTPLPLPLGDHVTLAGGGKIYVLGGDHDYDFENRAKAEVISLDTELCNE